MDQLRPNSPAPPPRRRSPQPSPPPGTPGPSAHRSPPLPPQPYDAAEPPIQDPWGQPPSFDPQRSPHPPGAADYRSSQPLGQPPSQPLGQPLSQPSYGPARLESPGDYYPSSYAAGRQPSYDLRPELRPEARPEAHYEPRPAGPPTQLQTPSVQGYPSGPHPARPVAATPIARYDVARPPRPHAYDEDDDFVPQFQPRTRPQGHSRAGGSGDRVSPPWPTIQWQHLPLGDAKLWSIAGSVVFAAVMLNILATSPVISSLVKERNRQCQEVIQPSSVLSRAQLTQLLTVPERSPKDEIRTIVSEPYCRMPSLKIRAGVTALREAYPLEFDPETWIVLLYEGDEYAGYRFNAR